MSKGPAVVTATPEGLVEACKALADGVEEGIAWVRDVRPDSARLDREADGISIHLHREGSRAKRLAAAVVQPVAVGFFGLSQAGKSYLISALARGKNGALETDMDGQRLNFIAHINPPGGGKEATGIVTRFTRRRLPTPAGFPVALRLFSEADLVRIIGNSFFMDFDRQKVSVCSDPAVIALRLDTVARKASPGATGGMGASDVVDLMDYFNSRFPRDMEPYKAGFWLRAVDLVPRLDTQGRAELFSLLWGDIPEFTVAWTHLAETLRSIGHAPRVFAALDALVVPDGAGGFSQKNSIMNVDMLGGLGRDNMGVVQVVTHQSSGKESAVAVARPVLAALACEMSFCLADPPQASMLEQVDLLDFPGYRGRLNVGRLADVAERLEGRDPVAELVLRGKVAYLFERYTEDQEMNALVLCTPCHKQSDVNDLGPALQAWIESTQGATPEERSRRDSGLVWTITMFDERLKPRPDETMDLIREGWGGMMRLTLLEKFEQFEWVNTWAPNQPFDTVFLVRKPGMAPGVIEMEGRQEVALAKGQEQRLAAMRGTFVEDDSVRRHVRDPAAAWDAALTLDDGGMARLAAYLGTVAKPDVKLGRIAEQVSDIRGRLVSSVLGPFYQVDGEGAVAHKQDLARQIQVALQQRLDRFGELVHALQPTPERLRTLYYDLEETGADEGQDHADLETGSLFSLDLSGFGQVVTDPVPASSPGKGGRAARYARAVMSDWMRSIRDIPANTQMHRFLGMTGDTLQILVDELITGMTRCRLEAQLIDALREAEERASTTRGQLVDRQTLVAATCLGSWVDWLGFGSIPTDKRPVSSHIAGRRLFSAPAPVADPPDLPDSPINYPALYLVDWIDAFREMAVSNAGHLAGSEIGPEHNRRLGRLLDRMKGPPVS
ncbi:hypothetical protein HEQ72_10120 [Haematospirillum sp. 15-248]|uniref:putative virulence factor n=1 Tax=Haematospirillum sp. 15-248 TaxID=2723107 RepID=UPI00143AB9E9|nr:virulence factor SrfC family protein [Haematospirillum sp. 15-248]NKD88662.1 hypothetical protein [Haematospirillum sp. 15-248]